MSDQPYLTAEGAIRLKAELDNLKGPQRDEMARRLRVVAKGGTSGAQGLEALSFPRDRIVDGRLAGTSKPPKPPRRTAPAWLGPETLAYVQRIRALYPHDRHPFDAHVTAPSRWAHAPALDAAAFAVKTTGR